MYCKDVLRTKYLHITPNDMQIPHTSHMTSVRSATLDTEQSEVLKVNSTQMRQLEDGSMTQTHRAIH